MSESTHANMKAVGQCWSRTFTSMVRSQWSLLDSGLQAVQAVLAAAPDISTTEATPHRHAVEAAKAGVEELMQRALERTSKGLSPPKQIYDLPYRNQIDWSRFPDWARPSDPELFEGSCHEG